MASITIRNIPDDVKLRFRMRAASNGRSMEEEARQMICDSVSPAADARPSMFEILYQASRPGVEWPEVPDTPATYATFDDE